MTRFILIVTAILMSVTLNAQAITLDVDATLMVSPSTCDALFSGQTVSFVKGSSCGGNVGVSSDGGDTYTLIAPNSLGEYEYTFADNGTYTIACGVSSGAMRGGPIAYCAIVTSSIPTLGEWGLISLSLLLMICAVVGIRSTVTKGVQTA